MNQQVSEQGTVIAAFTEMVANYERTVDSEIRQFWGVGYREFIAAFVARMNLTGRERVLDIGTGMCVVPVTLLTDARWQGEVVGLDITPGMLCGAGEALAREGLRSRVGLVCGSGLILPFQDGSFDAVTCALATHHMHVPTLLHEVHRVLRPGGQVLLADVGLADFWGTRSGKLWVGALATIYGWTQSQLRVRAELDAMKNMLTPEAWAAMLNTAGFAQVNMQVITAKRRWYPPGLLMQALSNHTGE
jgi:ubiquinone/menaquinone biosynthesis C-methylase UbiE